MINTITVKSIDELQSDTRIKNNKDLDQLCNNCLLVIGWSFLAFVLCLFIVLGIVMVITSIQ